MRDAPQVHEWFLMNGPVILNRQRRHRVSVSRLRRFLILLSHRLRLDNQTFTIALVSDRAIRRFNRDFRNQDKPTDVLSFPAGPQDQGSRQCPEPSLTVGLLKRPEVKTVARASARAEPQRNNLWDFDGTLADALPHLDKPGLGDMIISVETARRQAFARHHSLERELCVLAIHGLLHLLGYDHEVDRGEMHRKELKLQRELL
ncbi:MAG: rRNA maturation RNase YbeY [Terriglobia bacterium]